MDGLPLSQLTPIGALLLVVVMVVTLVVRGKLMPRATVDALLSAQEKRLVDRDATNEDLIEANKALTEALRTLTVQSDETLELGRATHAVIAALDQVRGVKGIEVPDEDYLALDPVTAHREPAAVVRRV